MTAEERIPTNLRTLLILEIIARHDRPLTATQINEELGLPKQTIHRLMATLEREGFLIREAKGNAYRPARRLRHLGAGLVNTSQVHIARRQILESISATVRETVNYVIPQETGMHYLDRVETDWVFRVQLPRGSNVPFHCTASGKVFMASLSKAARHKFVVALTLTQHTQNTHTAPETLLDELALTAKRGFALDKEEYVDDMVAIAVPVRDHHGRFVAALATHGPKQRLNLEEPEFYENSLKAASLKLSAALF